MKSFYRFALSMEPVFLRYDRQSSISKFIEAVSGTSADLLCINDIDPSCQPPSEGIHCSEMRRSETTRSITRR